MRYVIAYDVSDNARRARMAKKLESVGERVQGSVFEADLNEKALERLMGQLAKLVDAETDGVRLYRLCADCARETRIVGQSK
ncbi:MAG: CRISPR-associated endonuclease Cas2, partial [Anaerolineales bacterium]